MHVLLPSSCHRSQEQIVLLRRTRTANGWLTFVLSGFKGNTIVRTPVTTGSLQESFRQLSLNIRELTKDGIRIQSLLTDLSIQLLRQCQIATVINVKKFVTCSIQRKNNWIIFAVSCRDNGNNSSCKGQKLIIMVQTLLRARKKNAFLIRKLAQQPLSSAARS